MILQAKGTVCILECYTRPLYFYKAVWTPGVVEVLPVSRERYMIGMPFASREVVKLLSMCLGSLGSFRA